MAQRKKNAHGGFDLEALVWARDINQHYGNHEQLTKSHRLLLFYLATRTDPDRHECFPSQTRMAQDLGYSRRRVIEIMQELEDLGLVVSAQPEDGGSKVYCLQVGNVAVLPQAVAVQNGGTKKLTLNDLKAMDNGESEKFSIHNVHKLK